MASAAERSNEKARLFRAVVDRIEEILKAGPAHPQYEVADRWFDRLIKSEVNNPSAGAYGNTVLSVAGGGHERHTSGGGQAWRDDLVLEGRVD